MSSAAFSSLKVFITTHVVEAIHVVVAIHVVEATSWRSFNLMEERMPSGLRGNGMMTWSQQLRVCRASIQGLTHISNSEVDLASAL